MRPTEQRCDGTKLLLRGFQTGELLGELGAPPAQGGVLPPDRVAELLLLLRGGPARLLVVPKAVGESADEAGLVLADWAQPIPVPALAIQQQVLKRLEAAREPRTTLAEDLAQTRNLMQCILSVLLQGPGTATGHGSRLQAGEA